MFSPNLRCRSTILAISVMLLSEVARADVPVSSFQPDLLFHSLRHGASQIYLANSVTGESKRLRESANEDIGARWSPDGKKIAFVSRENGNSDIYVVDADGSNLKRLTDHQAFDGLPAWSPDGLKLAFASGRSGSNKLYVINIDGSGLKRLTDSANQEDETNHEWSPDGRKIAFVTLLPNREVVLSMVNSDGSGYEQLTKTADGKAAQPAWSPDGAELAYVEAKKNRVNLRVVNVASKSVRKLTDDDFRSSKPRWTPDGRYVVFESLRLGSPRTDLYLISSKGGEAVNLTATPADEEMDCAVSENGRDLAFVRFVDGKPAQLFSLDIDSKTLKQLTKTGSLEFQPAWRPSKAALKISVGFADTAVSLASAK